MRTWVLSPTGRFLGQRLGGFVVGVAMLASSAGAQTPARAFEELSQVVEHDDIVVVPDNMGRETSVTVADVSTSVLTVVGSDPLWDGTLLGLAAVAPGGTLDYTRPSTMVTGGCELLSGTPAMSLIRYLSCACLMTVLPLVCHAQERPAPRSLDPQQVGMFGMSFPSLVESQTPSRSTGRDSLLNGAVIGFTVGAGLGIFFVHQLIEVDGKLYRLKEYSRAALIFGGMGAAAGMGIDALLQRDSPVIGRSPQRVSLGLVVSPKTTGIVFLTRW